jgi:hypothetical protein
MAIGLKRLLLGLGVTHKISSLNISQGMLDMFLELKLTIFIKELTEQPQLLLSPKITSSQILKTKSKIDTSQLPNRTLEKVILEGFMRTVKKLNLSIKIVRNIKTTSNTLGLIIQSFTCNQLSPERLIFFLLPGIRDSKVPIALIFERLRVIIILW